MRKLFTLIGVALLSIASLHATSFTQNVDLSGFAVYVDGETPQGTFNPSTLKFAELIAWGGGQIWYGDDANALAVGDYTHICMDLAEVADNDVYLGVEYTTEDGHSAQSLTIAAGKKNAILQLTGASIKKIEIKNWSGNADASFTLSGVYFYKVIGKEETHTLYSGSYSLANWDWDSRLQIANTLFASAHDGDKIIITYNSEANADPNYVGAQVRVGETNATFTYVDEDEVITESQTGATNTFILRDADVAGVQAKGMYINGKKIVITKVELVTYSQQVMVERTLNTGSETLDWNQHWIHQGDLPTLSAGDELRITVSGVESGQYWQVNFRHNDSGEDAITFGSSDETTPKVYSFALTAEQATNINNGKLLIVGCNVTLSRFAVAHPQSIYDAAWRGETSFDDSGWGVNVEIGANKFTGLAVGDLICVNLSNLNNGGTIRMLHNWTSFAPQVEYVFNANHVAPMTVNFVVNQDMRDAILSDGIRVCGYDFTMTEVYMLKASARTESYTLTVSDAGMATLVLPFNVPTLPDGVEAYTLSNDGSNVIDASEVSALHGDKAVLIIAEAGDYVFTSELGGNADISGKNHWPIGSYENEALVGNYAPTLWVPSNGQPNGNNYILQNGAEGLGFYKVTADDCTLAPYRAYLSCSYNAVAAGAPMRIRFKHDVVTAAENVAEEGNVQKLLRDGQLLIRRGENIYTIQGQIVK